MPRVTLYTKPGCGLCEEMEEVIRHVRRRRPFELELRNILDSLDEYERYKHDIPVVTVDGVEIARHHMTESELEAGLG
jgi:hypothetical protein